MDSPLQITQQIRFALDTLGENNGHHEFEKICFAFGRRRISLNLLPATGPVSSGGDQGRDSPNAANASCADFSVKRVTNRAASSPAPGRAPTANRP